MEFTIEISETTTVKSGGVEVQYDPTVLEFISAEWSLPTALIKHYDASRNLGAFAFSSGTEISGVIFTLKCRVLDSANFDRSDVVLALQLKDEAQNPIEITSNQGSITVMCRHENKETIITDDYLKNAASCTQVAEYYYHCSDCDDMLDESYQYGEMLDHVYNCQITTDEYLRSSATCSAYATYYYACECGKTDEEAYYEFGEYDNNAHAFELIDSTLPGCETEGEEHYKCSDCGCEKTETTPASGHNEFHHDAKAPTCTEIGWDAYITCSECGYTTYNQLAPTGHTLGEWYESVAPTYSSVGEERRECSGCDYAETREIPMLDPSDTETEKNTDIGSETSTETGAQTEIVTKPETEAEKPTESEQSTEKKSAMNTLFGCSSTVGIGTLAIVCVAAAGFVSFRKKERDE